MKNISPFLFLLSSVLLGSCAQPGLEYKPTMRVGTVVVDSMTADLSTVGFAASGDTEYSSAEFAFGFTAYKDGQRKTLTEFVVAQSTFGGVDALEIAGGGRYYFPTASKFTPFLGLYSVGTILDDNATPGISPGTQLGLRLGLGGEIEVHENIFFDTSLRYLFPLTAAEAATNPIVETELSGLSLEIGIGFRF